MKKRGNKFPEGWQAVLVHAPAKGRGSRVRLYAGPLNEQWRPGQKDLAVIPEFTKTFQKRRAAVRFISAKFHGNIEGVPPYMFKDNYPYPMTIEAERVMNEFEDEIHSGLRSPVGLYSADIWDDDDTPF